MVEYPQRLLLMMKKLTNWILALALLLTAVPRVQAAENRGYHVDLSSWIQRDSSREYVEMMLDYHLRTNEDVRLALSEGYSAVFLFEGCSDNMTNPMLNDLSYYRVSAVCLALRLDRFGQVELTYFNDNCSTIPDRPLDYGAWSFKDVGKVGPATVCDGTYQLYSVRHKGRYEALHARTEFTDATLEAVYLTPDGGFTSQRANEINIHTRTGNHILENSMWSAGCPLVGGGESWEFWKLMEATYYRSYDSFQLENFVGTVTIDRMSLRSELYTLYQNPDAVDMFLASSRSIQPEMYLRQCQTEVLEDPKTQKTAAQTQLMTLPCSNGTDARSRTLATLEPGQKVTTLGRVSNTQGSQWLQVQVQGQRGYVYAPSVENLNMIEWLLDWLFG